MSSDILANCLPDWMVTPAAIRMRTEAEIILANLMTDISFFTKWSPLMQAQYFQGYEKLFTQLSRYVEKYNQCPTKEQLLIELDEAQPTQEQFDAAEQFAADCDKIAGEAVDMVWLEDRTRTFVKSKHQVQAILDLIQKSEKQQDISAEIQKLLTPPSIDETISGLDSASTSFAAALHEHLTADDSRIPFDIEWLNGAVRGVKRQMLNVILAPTNHGKSLLLCHLAASYMRRKMNVLYVTLEMAEATVAVRVHANLFDSPIEQMERWSLDQFQSRSSSLSACGRLIVRGYPTGTAHVGHFRQYLDDLKKKAQFVPDIICIDYLNICASERMKGGGQTTSYQIIGAISKELRALAQTTNSVVWTATQTNRAGLDGNVKLNNTSDSLQTAFDADLVVAMWKDDQLPNRIHFRIGKDRNGNGADKHGLVGVDTSRMRIIDLDDASLQEAQSALKKLTTKRKPKAVSPSVVFDIDKEAA